MRKIFAFMLLSVMMMSCSPYALVNSETYNGADLSEYHTFRIVTPADGHLPPGIMPVTYYNIAAAIREQMLERGFVEDPSSPLLINIGITIHREIETEPALPPGYTPYPGPYYNGYYPCFMYPRNVYLASYYANARVITGIYKEGVLTMDFVDIRQKLPLYSASVATIMDNGRSRFRNLKGIAEATQTLFSRFPVPLLPKYRADR
ncbi:MAG: DUF4136 domain-containing protein [Muribaculaceae bacterium]|nr:DUF4136 domain-containing protein [Muribaculaceae bacterium]